MSRVPLSLRAGHSALAPVSRRQNGAGRVIVAALALGLSLSACYRPYLTAGGPPSPTAAVEQAATGTPLSAEPPAVTPASRTATPMPGEPASARVQAEVVEVVDGDTIKVLVGDRVYTVRYIGIDTPETMHPERPVEWMGPEASAKNAEMVAGKIVTLEMDVSETDRFGRLLRYVYVGDLMVNAELVRLGYAQVSTFPPDVRYQDLFLRLEAEARDAGRGLWSQAPTLEALPNETITPQPPRREGCDPAYPDVCIAPPPPDLDCGDIAHRRFRVLPPDPHRFDADGNGIGCEGQSRLGSPRRGR